MPTEFLDIKNIIQVGTGKYKVGTHLSLITVLVLFAFVCFQFTNIHN